MLHSVSESAGNFEQVAIFDEARGPRLLQAEQFVLAWTALFGAALTGARLGLSTQGQLFAVARFDPERFTEAIAARFSFWVERAGGNQLALADLDLLSRANFLTRLERCEHSCSVSHAASLPAAFAKLLAAARVKRGKPSDDAGLRLEADLNKPFAFRWDAPARQLLVYGDRFLPVGDVVRLTVTVPGETELFSADGVVAETRGSPPEGVALTLFSPSAKLVGALARLEAAPKSDPAASNRRTTVRFPVKAPVRVAAEPS